MYCVVKIRVICLLQPVQIVVTSLSASFLYNILHHYCLNFLDSMNDVLFFLSYYLFVHNKPTDSKLNICDIKSKKNFLAIRNWRFCGSPRGCKSVCALERQGFDTTYPIRSHVVKKISGYVSKIK